MEDDRKSRALPSGPQPKNTNINPIVAELAGSANPAPTVTTTTNNATATRPATMAPTTPLLPIGTSSPASGAENNCGQLAQPPQQAPPTRTKPSKHAANRPGLHSRVSSAARVHRYTSAAKGTGLEKTGASNHRRSTPDGLEHTAREQPKKDLKMAGQHTSGPATNPAPGQSSTDTDPTPAISTAAVAATLTPVAARRSLSQTNLGQRTKSHAGISRRKNRSSDKLRRNPSGTGVAKVDSTLGKEGAGRPAPRTQVHFALGTEGDGNGEENSDGGDEDDDEWVDASGSASPYLSRNASVKSDHSNHGPSEMESDHRTVIDDRDTAGTEPTKRAHPAPRMAHGDLVAVGHNQLLTSKLLQRVPSGQQAVPPKISPLMASASTSQTTSPATASTTIRPTGMASAASETLSSHSNALHVGHKEGLTTRFATSPSTGAHREDSYRNVTAAHVLSHPNDIPNRPESAASPMPGDGKLHARDALLEGDDERALAPKPSRRIYTAGPGENYRTQMKLELQRASAVTEPGQAAGGSVGISSLIGFGDPGLANSVRTDPRVAKLLERTGMEYHVVRRYQNPIDRSFRRLTQLDLSQTLRQADAADISQSSTITGPARSNHDSGHGYGHVRNGSLPEHSQRRPAMKRPDLPRAVSTIEVAEYDSGRPSEQVSVGNLAGPVEDTSSDIGEDETTLLLRRLWDQPVDLSAVP